MTISTATLTKADKAAIEKLIPATLFRLTDGLPIKELHQMVSEAKDCEAALEADILLLEKAADNSSELTEEETTLVNRLLAYELTPPDRFFSISALLGRMRDPLAPPLPPNSTVAAARAAAAAAQPLKKKKSTTPTGGTSTPTNSYHVDDEKTKALDRCRQLLTLDSHPEFWRKHTDSAQLLAAWKRLSSHRTAAVFRRPVNPKEAPGYTDRILFPIDLSLIRKMIVASLIQSWADLQMRLQQICHNCVKFNGRTSDYAIVTRDFEAHVEEVILQLVHTSSAPAVISAAPKSSIQPTAEVAVATTKAAAPAAAPPAAVSKPITKTAAAAATAAIKKKESS